jgi:hypothetical protein
MGNTNSNNDDEVTNTNVNKLDESLFNDNTITSDISGNTNRINWENNLKILALIDSFGTSGFFGSAEFKQIDTEQILSRAYLINYIKKLQVPKKLVDWIETNMPNKLIKKLYVPLCLDVKVENNFKSDKEYYLLYLNDLLEFYHTKLVVLLTNDEKTKLVNSLRIYNLISKDDYLKISNIDNLEEDVLNKTIKIKPDNFIKYTKTQKQDYIKKVFTEKNSQLDITINIRAIEEIVYSNFDVVMSYLNLENFQTQKIDYKVLSCFDILSYNYGLHEKTQSIKDTHLTKYYTDVYAKTQLESTLNYKYYLNFEDHWNMYCIASDKYLDLLTHNFLIDDYTFNYYPHDDFKFLNGFNDTVKQNIITKIQSDNNQVITNRYGKIHSLEDLVDISVFIQNPPSFLKLDGIDYYGEYNLVLAQVLKQFGYDMSKLQYTKFKLKYMIEFDASL